MTYPTRIALVGFMGAGKTTVGRALAERLHYAFFDTDDEIEKTAGASIQNLFHDRGEGFFREQEANVVRRLVREKACVVSTGGGAFIQPECADLLFAATFTVFLDCEFDEAFRRASLLSGRPLLDGGKNAVAALYAGRKEKYSRAHVTVDTTHRSPDEVVAAVLKAFL